MKKYLWLVAVIGLPFSSLAAQDLSLGPEDVLIFQGHDSGYELWIRKKPDIQSVLLTESTRDPEGREANYGLRNPTYHPQNGDEKRILDGRFIESEQRLYFLVDSTPESHPVFGQAFHIFIPYLVVYGYPWARSGQLEIKDDTFINIRTFAKPYADYSGPFKDNPFKLVFVQRPLPPDATSVPPRRLKETEQAFGEIAQHTKGQAFPVENKEEIVEIFEKMLKAGGGESLDLVLCLDTTASMEDDISFVKQGLIRLMQNYARHYKKLRVGVVFYKDYFEQYLYKVFPFNENTVVIENIIQSSYAQGGRDTPEAVYEALYAALTEFKWQAEVRLIVLVGDAPPHPFPRGKITPDMVFAKAEELKVQINTIILPQ